MTQREARFGLVMIFIGFLAGLVVGWGPPDADASPSRPRWVTISNCWTDAEGRHHVVSQRVCDQGGGRCQVEAAVHAVDGRVTPLRSCVHVDPA